MYLADSPTRRSGLITIWCDTEYLACAEHLRRAGLSAAAVTLVSYLQNEAHIRLLQLGSAPDLGISTTRVEMQTSGPSVVGSSATLAPTPRGCTWVARSAVASTFAGFLRRRATVRAFCVPCSDCSNRHHFVISGKSNDRNLPKK